MGTRSKGSCASQLSTSTSDVPAELRTVGSPRPSLNGTELDSCGRCWTTLDRRRQRTTRRGGAMADDSLAKQLARLRVRAGNPSLRDLEKLTDRQGRRMSRASIQD